MRLFKKEHDTVQVLCFPEETVEKGDYLVVEDLKAKRSLLVQVVDIQFANLPGMMEDLVREDVGDAYLFGEDYDPLQLNSQITLLRDIRILLGKIRCSIQGGSIDMNVSWLPSRVHSQIYRLKPHQLFELLKLGFRRPIKIGDDGDGFELRIDADALDGKLSIITGRKGSGKSHLSKLLVLGLVDHGAPVLVFDVNGEYVNLGVNPNGEKNRYHDRIMVLNPAKNFKVTLSYMGLATASSLLAHVLSLPETSLREFSRIWKNLERSDSLSLKSLKNTLRCCDLNEHVREALLSRVYTLERSGFVVEEGEETVRLEDFFAKTSGTGGAAVINLSRSFPLERKLVVEFTLSKLVELLRVRRVKACFLFAEEAHLYLRETYWEDAVTRMRHLGLFTTFITNRPDSIGEDIYRQADSIFLFNFKNEHDLNAISKAARIDGETMKAIAQSLKPHHCMTIGQVTGEIPFVIRVKPLDVKTMGETRTFFS
ncbi:ATP-binding protein [Candidatus Hecatella orcuttiae]|jgi:hypothetical protein|uniref:ATP-binding protein n=1 Tax=Candidatus Hecatella orcuttiae TaxID=1935119 RepID=UPI0028682E34|nr:ATP-binding protein [Candidatus Hecatella orcuttiae]